MDLRVWSSKTNIPGGQVFLAYRIRMFILRLLHLEIDTAATEVLETNDIINVP